MYEGRAAFAAFDFGTTTTKGAVLLPDGSFPMIGTEPNQVSVTAKGGATCRASEALGSLQRLLSALQPRLQEQRVTELHIGLCGHVPSLLLWDTAKSCPVDDDFPIWQDASSRKSVPAVREFFAEGRDIEILATAMPAVPNWLAVMIYDRLRGTGAQGCKILQLHDYLYHVLTGRFDSHFSGQVSIVNADSSDYADELLKFLGINRDALPELGRSRGEPVRDPYGLFRDIYLPIETYVYPGFADRTAGFIGLELEDHDGFLLASTSENMGIFLASKHKPNARLLRTCHGDGWIHYGSTIAGGSTVSWFVDVFGGETGRQQLSVEDLHSCAANILPGSGGIVFHPYLNGERAPLWNDALGGSFTGLRAHHRQPHLFRALLEGIALGKRHLLEALRPIRPHHLKVCGGGARHPLQNEIRASVLGMDLEVYSEAEFALRGLVTFMREKIGEANTRDLLPPVESHRVEPKASWSAVYDDLYEVFIKLQESQSEIWESLRGIR